MEPLLTRDDFREAVFARDGHKCVFCGAPAVDAHHIVERRLFPCHGYHVSNGASVCEYHHIACEQTILSADDARIAAGIERVIIPPHLYDDQPYDKWGNPILPNGMRARGELFFDESVQKILREGGMLDMFSEYVKYPRTHHLPWSGNINSDDRIIDTLKHMEGRRVVVTRKMDGESTTMYRNYIHARSIDGRSHPSRDWVKQFRGTFGHDIPEGWRVCGENMYAQHSIVYDDLDSYFYGFSVWNERNVCLDWDTTMEWFHLLGITPVAVLYDGIFDEHILRKLADGVNTTTDEGFVVRVADAIEYGRFRYEVAKWVRKDHVQTIKHWMYGQPVVPNKLKGK